MVYLDSSALVKLVIAEDESSALQRYLRTHTDHASSVLARVEVLRSVRPRGTAALKRARSLLRRLDLVQIDDELLEDAATLDSGILRSLDAIHLAAARVFGDDLTAIVTYDQRMAKAAAVLGMHVDTPR